MKFRNPFRKRRTPCDACGEPIEPGQARVSIGDDFDHPVQVVHWDCHFSQGTVRTHRPEQCAGQACCVHNPSDHHMRDWPLAHRTDRPARAVDGRTFVLSERGCPHGCGHPDPDSVAYGATVLAAPQLAVEAVHGCDGCCIAPADD